MAPLPPPRPIDPMAKLTLSIFGICIGFSVGLGILFFALPINYYTGPTSYFGVLAIIMIGLIFMMNCFFFRAFVTEKPYISDTDSSAIRKITPDEALKIFLISLLSLVIVIITVVIVYGLPMLPFLNSDMNSDVFINIFANTIGYWVVKSPLFSAMAGTETLQEIMGHLFHSKSFTSAYGENNTDFSFLITALDYKKIKDLEDALNNGGKDNDKPYINIQEFIGKLEFDFCLYDENGNYDRAEYIKQLKTLVLLKSKVGHYMWMNMSGLVALVVAMISSIIRG
jgi:hypothetical protein